MAYTTSNEDDYYFDVPFAFQLRDFADKRDIRLGEFKNCTELLRLHNPSHYLVTFHRVHERGFQERVTVIVNQDSGDFQFHISAAPI